MKKVFLLGILILGVLFIGCIEIGVKDCGTDLDCFIKSLDEKRKAKISYENGLDLESLDTSKYARLGGGSYHANAKGKAEIIKFYEVKGEIFAAEVTFTNITHKFYDAYGETKINHFEKTNCVFDLTKDYSQFIGCDAVKSITDQIECRVENGIYVGGDTGCKKSAT